ncbi:MAG: TldD/PmbA family protein [Anaerolineales bacterium]|nr:TldD/PmbA family protein [Anaerolineales bacterium]
MDELCARALETAQLLGARYADVRLTTSTEQSLAVTNGRVDGLTYVESTGLGVRVLVGDAWGFAATRSLAFAAADQVAARAVDLAKASSLVPGAPVDLGPPVTSRGAYVTPLSVDPFSISVEAKLELLLAAETGLARAPTSHRTVRHGNLGFIREDKQFANTEGADLRQTLYESGGGISVLAISEDDVQRRSYPSPYRQQSAAGWEFVLGLDLPGHAERIAAEAVQLLSADPCPSDPAATVIIGSEQLALQVHESCGHPVELDRVFGAEAAYAGASFLTPDMLGRFQYGSPAVNLTADAVRQGGLGTFGWDDEGVPATSTPIVQAGRFVGYLMSRETAARLGRASNGCMRAAGWNRLPLIRMTNVSLEPGHWALDDLIADSEAGLYFESNRSWSIDDKRYNFQFGTEVGYEIKHGRLGRMLRDCTYTGVTPEFWNSCDAVCDAQHWVMWGTPNCGKGQPSQIIHTGHGAAPARFRNVRVGVYRA